MTKNFGVIFDFNGTLFYDSAKHAQAFKELCHEYGVEEYSDEYIAKNIFGKNNRRIILESFKGDATEEEIKYFDRIKEERYQKLCLADKEFMHLVKGAPEFLDYLKENNIPYAIATGSPMFNIQFYLEHLELSRWFTLDNIVYDDGTLPCKPAPDIYIKAAQRLGIEPKNCIVFEDAFSGIVSANRAEIGGVWALLPQDSAFTVSEEAKLDGTIHDFTNYLDILKKYI